MIEENKRLVIIWLKIGKLPRESPMRKRVLSAHWLRESDWEDGIFHASALPPTKISLASQELMTTNKSTKAEIVLEKTAAIGSWERALESLCFCEGKREMIVMLV